MKTTPQEKKIRDYSHQRKNCYGENDKSSRNALRKRKRWVNRSYRRSVKNRISLDIESVDDSVKDVKKHDWKKDSDKLLVTLFDKKWAGSSRTGVKPHKSTLKNEALRRIRKSNAKDIL